MVKLKQEEFGIKALLNELADDMQEFILGTDCYSGEEEESGNGDGSSEFYNYLSYNYTILGQGHYSVVVDCPWDKTKAIKIGHGAGGNGDIINDGWLSWAAFCMNMHKQGNYPNLPVIHDMLFRENIFIALIEKYTCTWKDRESCVFKGLVQAIDVKQAYFNITQAFRLNHAGYTSYKPVEAVSYDVQRILAWLEHPMCPRLTDTHDGNFMIDLKNDTVILNDPCADNYLLKDKRVVVFEDMGIDIQGLLNNYGAYGEEENIHED